MMKLWHHSEILDNRSSLPLLGSERNYLVRIGCGEKAEWFTSTKMNVPEGFNCSHSDETYLLKRIRLGMFEKEGLEWMKYISMLLTAKKYDYWERVGLVYLNGFHTGNPELKDFKRFLKLMDDSVQFNLEGFRLG